MAPLPVGRLQLPGELVDFRQLLVEAGCLQPIVQCGLLRVQLRGQISLLQQLAPDLSAQGFSSTLQISAAASERFLDSLGLLPGLLDGFCAALERQHHLLIVIVLPGGNLLAGLLQRLNTRQLQRCQRPAGAIELGIDAHRHHSDLTG
jgi:hypothetical protein